MARAETGDDAANARTRKAINVQSKNFKRVLEFLVGVVDGSEGDQVFTKEGLPVLDKEGKQVIKRATIQVRVQAAKEFRELVVDKIVPDKKHDPKVKDKDGSKLAVALKAVHDEMQKKAKAEQKVE